MREDRASRTKKGPPQGGGRPPKPPELQRITLRTWLTEEELFELRVIALRRKQSVADVLSDLIRQLIRQEKGQGT